jgi:DNA-binding winged helix-turn-helix (wHTH) protein/TolB-like protein
LIGECRAILMQKLSHQVFSFGEFTLDLRRGCLMRAQEEIKLRPKSFEVLNYLVENNGRLISKDELIHAVWVEAAVTDDSLVQCLKDIRRALGDEAQQVIKTVHGRGYIFDTEVRDNGSAQITKYTEETAGVQVIIEEETDRREQHEIAAQTPQLQPAPNVSVVSRFTNAIKRHKLATAIASAVFVALIIAGIVFARPILFWWFKPPSIAVLPIVNATGDPNNNYIADGLTESLITSLNQINEPGKRPRLLVTAQGTVLIFRGKEIEPRSVGRELGVDTVLASQMLEQNGMWIIKVEMVNVANGSEMWRKQYSWDGHFTDAFLTMQDEIAKGVAGQLPLTLSGAERQRLTRRYTQNPAAYDAYLKGRASWFKTTPEGYRRSIEYYQQAIDLDPNYALPYVGMGLSYVLEGKIGARPYKEASEKATNLYLKALKIDNTLKLARDALELGEIEAWNWEAVEKAGPQHTGYHFPHGGYLIAMGRLDEQLAFENRILGFDPHSPLMNFFYAETLFLARQYDASIAQYQKTLNIVSGLPPEYSGALVNWIHSGLGHVYVQKAMFPEAIAEFNKARDLTEDLPPAWEELGYAYAKSGQKDEATRILNQLQERAKRGEYVLPLGIAWIYIGLGDKDQAFVWLEKSFEERSDGMRKIKTNPIYDPLRSDARFADLLKRMRLPT